MWRLMYCRYFHILCISECPQLESPQDGSVKITVGASEVATYSCNEGFTISGSDTRSCSSGTWTGQAPVCLPNGRSVMYKGGFITSGSDTKSYSTGVVEHGQVPGDRSCSTLSS